MKYPHKQTYTVFFTIPSLFRKKVVTLEIPQGSIGEIDRVRNMSEGDMSIWLASVLIQWGATRWEVQRLFMYQKEKVLEALQNTFFATRYVSIFPESVAELADKEEYRFNPPESVMFGVVAKNFRIPPRELLEYTYDELAYLLDSLRYVHLNDAQKAELQRLERVEEMKGKRQEIEELFAELEG